MVQFDPVFRLKLETDAPEGAEMPLTPFFAARLNTEVELVTGK